MSRSYTLDAVTHDPFAGAELSAFVPVSSSQKEVWFASVLEPQGNLSYNEGLKLTLRGALDIAALQSALNTIVARHESLRGVLSPDGLSMGVLASLSIELALRDVSGSANPAEAVAVAEEAQMQREFNLEQGPLVRFELLREGPELHQLLFVAHHIVCDGWSSAVILTELAKLYSARVKGEVLELPPAQRYGDYSQLEQAFLASEEGLAHEAYWLKLLADAPPTLDLPSSKPRPAQRGYNANRVDFTLPETLVSRLRQLGRSQNATLVATLLAGFATLLHKLTQSSDFTIGLAAAGQALHGQPQLVGHCVNLLPLRVQPQATQSFTGLLQDVRKTVLDAFDHQGVSFGRLLPKLNLSRDDSRPPLLNILFNIDVRDDNIEHHGLQVGYQTLVRRGEVFDLFINAVDTGREMILEASYNADVFAKADIEQRMAELQTLLQALVEAPAQTLAALPWIPEELLASAQAFNATAALLPTQTVAAQIAARAAQQPQALALVAGSESLSYEALIAKANHMAGHLHAAGVAKGEFVGVCMARSCDLVASLLAVQLLGAVFAPLDPEMPPERLAYYLKDCNARLLLTDAPSSGLLQPHCPVLQVESFSASSTSFPAPNIAMGDAAYIIYTSGSTGQPKGVVASHGGFANVLASWNEQLRLTAADRMAAVASISFDMAIVDFWAPLVAGATLVLLDRDTARDGELLSAALTAQQVNLLQATPATWRMLVAAGWQGHKRFRMVTGGEALPRDLAQALLARCAEVWNGYGPTETTVYSTLFHVVDGEAPLLIGKPLANTECHVLDAALNPLPPGVAGQLYIGGAGLALGYHQRPELTAASFIEHPMLGRLYRTGDLVRLTPEGLDYLGRNDFQVKLRGYRIELGEIEYALSQQAGVHEASVQVREKSAGDARIVAWVAQQSGSPPTVSSLRQGLRGFLPGYMIPTEFVLLDALPRLPNGKLNRAALADPFAQASSSQQRAPTTANEQAIAAIWAEVLGLPLARIGADDRFLELGGHSLLATQAAARIRKVFASQLPLRTLMMDPLSLIAASLPAQAAAAEAVPVPQASAANEPTPAAEGKKRSGWLGRLMGN